MSFNAELTSDQLNSLRGTTSVSPSHQAKVCISLCPNTVVFSARVNQTTFPASSVQLIYDGDDGDIADVRVGMTVLISHVDDPSAAFFTGRIRVVPDVELVYINETSAAIEDNDYIFVLEDFRVWDKLPRASGNTEYPDYEQEFRQLLPLISNLKGAYADEAVSSVLSLDFAPNVDAATDGATITDYLWEVGDGTITVGSDTDKDITVEFPPGFRYIHLTVTDSEGAVSVRHIPVWVHDESYPVTLLDHGDLEVSVNLDEGPSGSITAFAGIEDVLPNTLVCAWLASERYNGTAGHIFDNIALLGRLRREDNPTSYAEAQQDASTRFEIEGPLQQLARLEITSQQIEDDSTPTKFNQVAVLTVWREVHLILTEYSTFSELHSLTFDDTTDTYREKAIGTQQGNILAVVNALANGINAAIQMNTSGEAEIVRDGVMLDDADRDALVLVADWTPIDVLDFSIGRSHVFAVGRMDASGGSYNTANRKVIPALAVAPGVAQGYADGQQRLDNQILTANLTLAEAESEIEQRSGHALAKAQERDELTISHPDGYWFLTPSLNQWYTLTLDGSETARGIVLDTSTRWQLVSMTVTHEMASGTRSVQATYRRESAGAPGQSYRLPPQSVSPLTLPSFPDFPAFPGIDIGSFFLPDEPLEGQVPPSLLGSMTAHLLHDGNCVMYWTATQIFICNDFVKTATPTWIEITPELASGETIVAARFIPYTTPPGALIATAVSGDGGDEPGEWSHTWNAVEGWGPWGPLNNEARYGIINPAGNWQSGIDVSEWSLVLVSGELPIDYNLGSITFKYTFTGDTPSIGQHRVLLKTVATSFSSIGALSWGAGTYVETFNPGASFSNIEFDIETPPDHVVKLTEISASGTGPFPWANGGRIWRSSNLIDWTPGAIVTAAPLAMRIGETFDDIYLLTAGNLVYFSDDRGVTFSDAVEIGDPASSATGFDTQRTGVVTLGGADGKVRIASTAGGAYSDYTTYPTDAIPTAIFIPRYKLADASNNGSGEDEPDYITASEVGDTAAGHSLWKVTSGGGSVTQIDATSGALGLAIGPNCLHMPWYPNAYRDILAILSFSGTRKLARSLDAGSTWAFSSALSSSAAFITTRRSDAYRRQAFIANGAVLGYVSNYQASPPVVVSRSVPTTATILGCDILP